MTKIYREWEWFILEDGEIVQIGRTLIIDGECREVPKLELLKEKPAPGTDDAGDDVKPVQPPRNML